QRRVGVLAGDALLDQRDQEQVVVGTAGNDVVAARHDHLGHGPGVGDDLPGVVLELRLQRLLEGHRLGGDDVHQRAALRAREYQALQFLLDLGIGLGQDQAAAGAAQRLVGGG